MQGTPVGALLLLIQGGVAAQQLVVVRVVNIFLPETMEAEVAVAGQRETLLPALTLEGLVVPLLALLFLGLGVLVGFAGL